MNTCIVFFVDAPQHHRIVETMLGTLAAPCDVHVLATTDCMPSFDVPMGVRLTAHAMLSDSPTGGARFMQILRVGRKRMSMVRGFMASLARQTPASATIVVFNDTGIVQRDLLRMGRVQAWHTVLVQDGLTETTYREGRWGFQFKRAVTLLVLTPLGLAHYGTSRYGQSGARTILADGPAAARFFQDRAPEARVLDVGFLRPAARRADGKPHACILFWAVDFLGGLQDEALHGAQLRTIQALANALYESGSRTRLAVRMHPRDLAFKAKYSQALATHDNVDLIDPLATPDPFGDGVPLMSVSLQSAGVFDALAAGIPSYFIGCDGRNLGPAWVPAVLWLPNQAAFVAELRAVMDGAGSRRGRWARQTASLASTIKIPFDAPAVRHALQGVLPE